ncbi:hypothetical protein ROZALSC1DRAFT_20150 [Rozella allomycis CSF55]|uniref:Sensitive to high expression protein 9, mitochondrial n=1 Tax=Rozella allomycis (strain CSF55) TaxID=988480 RepID=A0A4P9YR96_ROZAC|nr:hypothetical protein ROZALSC1DRAFT_20150 [Rozella allomycis CSF55]
MNFLKQAQQEFKVAPKKLLFNTKYISNNVLLLKSQVLLYKSKFFPDKEIERYAREFDKLTGYDLCSQLRIKVIDQDKRYRDMKQQLSQIKERYENEVERRSDNQKELQELLQRKGSWSDTEIIRFAELHREEMKCDTNVKEAKKNLKYMEQVVDEAHQHLMNVMRERYHEEQLWSWTLKKISCSFRMP